MAKSKKVCKFGFKISAIVFAIQFTVFIALFFFISSFVSSSSRKSAISNMQTSALDRSEIIREYVISAEDSLTAYLRAGQIYSLLKDPTNEAVVAQAQKYTETFSKDLRNLEGIYASEWSTKVLTHTAAPVVGMVTRDTDEKRKPLHDAMLATEGVYNAGIITSPASGQQIISVYKAVKDDDGSPIGLGGIGIFTNELVNRLNETAIEGLPSAEYYLLNMDTKEYIFHPDPELVGTVAEGQYVSEIIAEARNGGDDYSSSLTYRDDNGGKRIAAFSKISGYNWVFVISDISSEVLAPVIRITIILAIVFVVSLAILITTVYLVITKMLAPLKKVEEAVIYLEGFRLGHTADLGDITKKDDEIGHIADAVNKLCGSLNGVIEDMGRILSDLARGNLAVDTNKNKGYYIGDFAAIRNNLGAIKGEMSGLLSKMQDASEKVYSGSGRVASISQTLSLGTPDQDGSIGGLVDNLGLIEHQIRDNAENCTAARSYMEKTSAAVTEVDERMEGLTKAMGEIADTSDQITNVVKTIEDIAFQTNILALNAAIEAARAGTEGKRFAVVADEVRKLAANSAEAVKDTTQLIESSVLAVKNGKDLTTKTAQSLEELEEYTNKVAQIVDDIAESGSKQAEMVGEINNGITGISNVVESNSATAQESAAASDELSKQAGILKELIGRFKLDE